MILYNKNPFNMIIYIFGQILEKFPTECYPFEMCSKCGSLLTIDNCYYYAQENINIMSCQNCIMDDDSFIKLFLLMRIIISLSQF